MTEPLVVDTAGLRSAGGQLLALGLPQPPPPPTMPGTDPVSAAVNQTLPVIESAVVQGLPAVQTALSATAAKFDSAAVTYAESDRRLGEKLDLHQFGSATGISASSSPARVRTTLSASAGDTAAADVAESPLVAVGGGQVAGQLTQVSTVATSVSSTVQGVVQNVQGVVQSVQGAVGGVASTPPVRDGAAAGEDTERDAAPTDDAAPTKTSESVAKPVS